MDRHRYQCWDSSTRKPVQIVGLPGRRHAIRCALFEDNLLHQGRIGKIRVRRGVRGGTGGVGNGIQARGIVVSSDLSGLVSFDFPFGFVMIPP